MSDYGLIVKNDSGGVQIDSTYSNFVLTEQHNNLVTNYIKVQHGLPLTHNDYCVTQAVYKFFPITSSPYPPLIAVQPVSVVFEDYVYYFGCTPSIIIGGINKTGNNYDGVWIGCGLGAQSTFNMRVYRESAHITPSNNTYALRVYNSQGELCFDSATPDYLKIHSSFPVSAPSLSAYLQSHSGISNPYYILSGTNFVWDSSISLLAYGVAGITRQYWSYNSGTSAIYVINTLVCARYAGSIPNGWQTVATANNNHSHLTLTIVYP